MYFMFLFINTFIQSFWLGILRDSVPVVRPWPGGAAGAGRMVCPHEAVLSQPRVSRGSAVTRYQVIYYKYIMYLTLNRRSESEKRKTELVDVLESVSYQLCGEDDISVDVFYEVTLTGHWRPCIRVPITDQRMQNFQNKQNQHLKLSMWNRLFFTCFGLGHKFYVGSRIRCDGDEWWEVVMELYVRVIAADLGLQRSAAQAAGLHWQESGCHLHCRGVHELPHRPHQQNVSAIKDWLFRYSRHITASSKH